MITTSESGCGGSATRRPTADCRPTCGCGQDLDCCSREHCPRCGSLVSHVELHPEHVSAGPLGWVA